MYTCICVCAYVCVCVCVNVWCQYGPYIDVCVEEVRDHGEGGQEGRMLSRFKYRNRSSTTLERVSKKK